MKMMVSKKKNQEDLFNHKKIKMTQFFVFVFSIFCSLIIKVSFVDFFFDTKSPSILQKVYLNLSAHIARQIKKNQVHGYFLLQRVKQILLVEKGWDFVTSQKTLILISTDTSSKFIVSKRADKQFFFLESNVNARTNFYMQIKLKKKMPKVSHPPCRGDD